jgi:hypothetical protein
MPKAVVILNCLHIRKTTAMLDYQSLCKDKRLYRSVLGIDQTEFQKLIPEFSKNLQLVRETRVINNPNRKRGIGGGCKPTLFAKPSKLLFYVLFFVRVYPTFDIAKLLFALDRSQLHYWYELGLEALELTSKVKIKLPSEKSNTLNKVFKKIPELIDHIADATEQPINRPKYNQEKYYSGKKKRHTIKRQVIISTSRRLLGISNTVEGKKHDRRLAKETKYLHHSPKNSTVITDLGYLGLKEDHPIDIRQITPVKKKKKRELSQTQKEYNKAISSIRVRVEHVICHLKYFKMFSDKLRYRKRSYDNRVANIVGGLYNLRFE